jgi:hypothetical protein
MGLRWTAGTSAGVELAKYRTCVFVDFHMLDSLFFQLFQVIKENPSAHMSRKSYLKGDFQFILLNNGNEKP